MKIVHFLWTGGIGGIERVVFDLSNFQTQDNSFDVTVLFGQKHGAYIEYFKNHGINIESASLNSGYDFSLKKIFQLKRFFKNFDLLHFHSFNPSIFIAGFLSRKSIIYTEHGTFGVLRKKNVKDLIKKYLKKLLLNRYCDYITFNSKYTKKTAEKLYGLHNCKRDVVYNGTDLTAGLRSKEGIDTEILALCQGKFIIGTSSRFTTRKKVDRLIKAFHIFGKQTESVLLLVGDGPDKTILEQMVNKLGMSDTVSFTGFQTNVTDYQDVMDVCVFPAVLEPFGLVAIEALALGKPTLVFRDGGGITEIIEPLEKNDVVNDEYGLASRLEFYFNHRENIHLLKEQRKHYVSKFSIDRMARDFYRIYSEVSNARAKFRQVGIR